MTHRLYITNFKTRNWEILNKLIFDMNTSIYNSIPPILKNAIRYNRFIINTLLDPFVERLVTDAFTIGKFDSSNKFITSEVTNLTKKISKFKRLKSTKVVKRYAKDLKSLNNLKSLNDLEYAYDIGNPFCPINRLQTINETSTKIKHLNCYLNNKEFMNKFIKYINKSILYSCTKAIQNEMIFNNEDCYPYFKQAIQFCFSLNNVEFTKVWLEFMIQVRYSPIGKLMCEYNKHKKFSRNIEYKSILTGIGRNRKCELDFVTHEYLGEIKFQPVFQPKEVINKLDNYREAMPRNFKYFDVNKYLIIDSVNCYAYYQR